MATKTTPSYLTALYPRTDPDAYDTPGDDIAADAFADEFDLDSDDAGASPLL
jgi:hypothetical protein